MYEAPKTPLFYMLFDISDEVRSKRRSLKTNQNFNEYRISKATPECVGNIHVVWGTPSPMPFVLYDMQVFVFVVY